VVAVCIVCFNIRKRRLHFVHRVCLCICRLLRTNGHYFPKQHSSVGLCNGDSLCFCEIRAECLNVVWMNFRAQRFNSFIVYYNRRDVMIRHWCTRTYSCLSVMLPLVSVRLLREHSRFLGAVSSLCPLLSPCLSVLMKQLENRRAGFNEICYWEVLIIFVETFLLYLQSRHTFFVRISICFLSLMGWDWVCLVLRPLFGLLYQPQMIDDECGAVGGMRFGRGNRSTWRKPAPVALCSPQIPHDLTRARTRAAAVGSQRLTSWAMARPISSVTLK
jgi:hypothetical protein